MRRFLLVIFLCTISSAIFISGCGGGGGGGGSSVNPVAPNPPTTSGVTGTVEGYVSSNKVSSSIKANIGQTLANPVKNAICELIAFDKNGVEQKLGTTTTDANGFYQFKNVNNPYLNKNLIVRAISGTTVFECIIPAIKNGQTVQAPTIDPTTTVQAKIIRKAAEKNKHELINLGELLSILSPDLLMILENKISEIVDAFIAREEIKRNKFGTAKNTLDLYALELQQHINELIEKGSLAPSEAWKYFDSLMTARAKELGLDTGIIRFIDDLDHKLFIEKFKYEFDNSEYKDEFEKIELEQVRERKLKALDTLISAVKVLAPTFSEFFSIAENYRSSILKARTLDELYMIFLIAIPEQRKFLEYLNHAMAQVGFGPEQINQIFKIKPPIIGFEFASKYITDNPIKIENLKSTSSITEEAFSLVTLIDNYLDELIKQVREIAISTGLSLSEAQIKAIAEIIWAGSPENLNLPEPPPLTDEFDNTNFSMTGVVKELQTPKILDDIEYNYALEIGDLYYVAAPEKALKASSSNLSSENSDTSSDSFSEFKILAYLTATQPIKLINFNKHIGTVGETKTVSLKDLTSYPLIEVEGFLRKAPHVMAPPDYPNYPENTTQVTIPGFPVNNKFPVRGKILAKKISRKTLSQVMTNGSSQSSEPITVPGVDVNNPEPYYLIIHTARILPPPPPPPIWLEREKGKIVQVKTSYGQIIPGVFIFESPNPTIDGALLEPDFPIFYATSSKFEDFNKIDFLKYLNQTVYISGTLITDAESSKKTILVSEISTDEIVKK